MRFAIKNEVREEASPQGKGSCPNCGGDVLAKCGAKRIWHWAHRVRTRCDHWWENETEWHRNWKTKFPNSWQEIILKGQDEETHIADVRTPFGLTVEFQHSPLSEIEQEVREEFYGNLIWVLDGAHGNQGYWNFLENIQFWNGRGYSPDQIGSKFNPLLAKITKRWLVARRPVFIDFGGRTVWSISVRRDGWAKYALEIPKEEFVRSILEEANPIERLSPWKV
jgi:competence protein CoiA